MAATCTYYESDWRDGFASFLYRAIARELNLTLKPVMGALSEPAKS